MELSVVNRIVIGNILPQKDNFVNMVLGEDIKTKIKIGQEEMEEIELKSGEEGHITWNSEKAKAKEFEFTDAENAFIKENLKKLDTKKELSDDTLELYKLFVV